MEFIISSILEKEWQMFQAVNSGLARTDCQDDPDTFARMRCAQFLTWSEEACRSYEQDLTNAEAEGRNLVEEKYIHIMENITQAMNPLQRNGFICYSYRIYYQFTTFEEIGSISQREAHPGIPGGSFSL